MLDCDHELWDRYAALCDRHTALLHKKPDAAETHEAHIKAYNVLQEILNHQDPDRRLPPEAEQVLECIEKHPMITAQEILTETGLLVDELRAALLVINDMIGMDSVEGIVRFWAKQNNGALTESQLDEVVRSYMERHGLIVVDDCAHHLGVTCPALRKSLVRIGFPRIYKANRAGTTTICYYPHGTTKETAKCPRQ